MDKLKEKVIDIYNKQKEYLKNYMISFIIVILTTVLMFIFGLDNESFDKLYVTLILSFILTFLVETIIKKIDKRVIFYILSIIISGIATHFIFLENVSLSIICLIIGVYLFATSFSIYKIINDKNNLSNFMIEVFQNNIFLGIASSIIQTGLIFIVTVIYELLLGNYDIDLYLKFEILFFGLFIIPTFILSILNTKEKITKFIKVIIYIMLSIVIISYTIIYLYFIKIFIAFSIPSNQIFRIITFLFIFAFPTWTMVISLKKENKFTNKISNLLPILFVPFIITQIYSLAVRINQNGITIIRYLGIVLIIFEIITVLFSLDKFKKYQNKIVLTFGILVLITTSIPYINAISVSFYSQYNILTSIYKENTVYDNLSSDEKRKVTSAYNYIIENLKLTDKLPDYISRDLYNKSNIEYTDTKNVYLNYESKNNEIDIQDFSSMFYINISELSNTSIDNYELLEFDIFEDESRNSFIKNQVKDKLKIFMNNQSITDEVIKVDDTTLFYIKSINLDYDDDKINLIYLEGYLFIK
ncbi:MAG: DUF4153 domain-containing protein [Bacilli bacterium]|nr:DUF4153 domain-containing protein [Bacilli bacterium]